MVYAASTIAIAVLETVAHINDGGLPLNRFVVRIDVPDDIWNAREQPDAGALPRTGAAIPAGVTSAQIGLAWLKSLRSTILLVPWVIVPEERAALIHPAHPDAPRLSASMLRAFDYNQLFRRSEAEAAVPQAAGRFSRAAASFLPMLRICAIASR